jgi:hypothetical protein
MRRRSVSASFFCFSTHLHTIPLLLHRLFLTNFIFYSKYLSISFIFPLFLLPFLPYGSFPHKLIFLFKISFNKFLFSLYFYFLSFLTGLFITNLFFYSKYLSISFYFLFIFTSFPSLRVF